MAKWSEEDKLKALAIAEASSVREASQQTGIPEGSIKRWRMEQRGNEPNDPNRTEPSKKIERIAEEAVEQAKEDVREYVADRMKQVSDGLFEMVELAKNEAIKLIESGQDPNDTKSQWLKAIVGAIAQGSEKGSLLGGKPTQRSEVNTSDKAGENHDKLIGDLRESLEEVRRSVGIKPDSRPVGGSDGTTPTVAH